MDFNNCNADCSEDYYAVDEEAESECTTFLIFGILMGCLVIVASMMMCLLAHRLNRVAISYKVGYHTIETAVMLVIVTEGESYLSSSNPPTKVRNRTRWRRTVQI